MGVTRRFCIAPALARLIMRERPTMRVVEGHFLPSDDRLAYVLFEDNTCTLVLITKPGSEAEEQERTGLPAKQGQFLLEVCTGTLVCYRVSLAIGDGREAFVSSFSIPGSLHLVEVVFEGQQQADQFVPPLWFGPEITDDVTFEHNTMATRGMPEQALVPITDTSIHAVLDLFDDIERSRWSPVRGEVEPLRAVQRTKASGSQ
jgi:CYTH domain-containing protein